MNKFQIFIGAVFLCAASSLYARVDSLNSSRMKIVFHKVSDGNYLLREEPENLACLRYVDGDSRNVFVTPGNSTTRSYEWATEACFFKPHRISWVMTTARKSDNLKIQCRINIIAERVNTTWSTQVKVEPYGQNDHHLCAGNKMIKSAACMLRTTDSLNRYRIDCLNKFVVGHYSEIEVTLDGSSFDISETTLNNPFDSHVPVDPVPIKPPPPCFFKFCGVSFSKKQK